MNDFVTVAATGLAIAAALVVAYQIGRWINCRHTLRAAEQIARTISIEQASTAASSALWDKLERFRLARVRANLGAPSSLLAAATELVHEHQLYWLERR